MQALGSIEVVGLVAGVEAADVACKTADVNLIGYELARGGGYVTVKVEGQVAAVQAAMAAAEVAASKLTRPHQELEPIVFSAATVGLTKPAPDAKATKSAAKAEAPEKTKPAPKAETKAQEKPEPESRAGTTTEPGPEPKAITKPEPKPQLEQAQPESGPDQKPDATPKNPAETTKAPRTSTTRRKQS